MPNRMLRCVGGPSDGRRVEFPGGVDEMPIINPIHIPDPRPGEISQSFPATEYAALFIKTPDGEIEFAAPSGWTIARALHFALK